MLGRAALGTDPKSSPVSSSAPGAADTKLYLGRQQAARRVHFIICLLLFLLKLGSTSCFHTGVSQSINDFQTGENKQ